MINDAVKYLEKELTKKIVGYQKELTRHSPEDESMINLSHKIEWLTEAIVYIKTKEGICNE